jgi:hypothetical protein
MRLKVIGRRGSTYASALRTLLDNTSISEADGIVNFGLQGSRLDNYLSRYPAVRQMPMLNARQFGNKLECVLSAIEEGVSAPDSFHPSMNRPTRNQHMGWLLKPYYSFGGRDIYEWRGGPLPDTHYLQRRVANRRYEIRVHAWTWIDPNQWVFQKRVHENGEDTLAWNHHNGGRFITINEPVDPLHNRIRTDVQTLASKFNYQFGAVDFIVQNACRRGEPLPHYFIEWNLAPGWTLDHVRDSYFQAFTELQQMTVEQFTWFAQGLVHTVTPDSIAPYPMPRGNEQRWVHVPDSPDDEDLDPPTDLEVNFCPRCGQAVNNNIFGTTPRFCPSCGQQVRR